GADETLHDFPYIYASGRDGFATPDWRQKGDSIRPLLDLMLQAIPGPEVEPDDPLALLVTTLDWSEYVGRIAIGRIRSGRIRKGQQVAQMQAEDRVTASKVLQLFVFDKLGRVEAEEAEAGDIVAIVGLENV